MIDTAIYSPSTQVLDAQDVLSAMETNLAMIEFDLNTNIIWVNQNFSDTLYYSPEEMIGMQHHQLCTKEYAQSPEYEMLWANLRKGKKFQEKILRLGKKGNKVWLEATYIPVLNPNGEPVSVLKIATDITARENTTLILTSRLKEMPAELVQLVMKNGEENIKAVEALKQQTDQIRHVADEIREISSQTNILALNAAIEAAHAAEYGKGFKRIAEEVKKLSDNVNESTKEVDKSVTGILNQAEQLSAIADALQKDVQDTQKEFDDTIASFEHTINDH